MKLVQFLFTIVALATLSSAWTVNFAFQPKGKDRVIRTYGGVSSKSCHTFKADERRTKMVQINFDGETNNWPDAEKLALHEDTECKNGESTVKELKVGKHKLTGKDTQRFNSWQIVY